MKLKYLKSILQSKASLHEPHCTVFRLFFKLLRKNFYSSIQKLNNENNNILAVSFCLIFSFLSLWARHVGFRVCKLRSWFQRKEINLSVGSSSQKPRGRSRTASLHMCNFFLMLFHVLKLLSLKIIKQQ